jgi:hypothetical protein
MARCPTGVRNAHQSGHPLTTLILWVHVLNGAWLAIAGRGFLLNQVTQRAAVSLIRLKHLQLCNAIVGAAEPPTKLAVDILDHHHIRVDVGLVARVEVSGRELVQHGWALRDDGG